MVKFFKQKPKTCSVCNQEKPIVKSVRSGLIRFDYCEDCYNFYFKKIEPRVKEQVLAAAKAGKTISIQDTVDLTKDVTKEVEQENAESVRE